MARTHSAGVGWREGEGKGCLHVAGRGTSENHGMCVVKKEYPKKKVLLTRKPSRGGVKNDLKKYLREYNVFFF